MSPSGRFSGKKILVTGASGFIGPHLCRRLCMDGADVHAVSRSIRSNSDNSPRCWRSDLSDISTVRKLLNTIRPDIIFHLSGHAAGGRGLELVLPTFHSNLTTTVNLLTIATETGCSRIVLPGSLEEPDDSNATPSSPYAAGKWASSAYARMFYKLYKTPVVNLRVFMTYGPGKQDPRKLLPYVITSLLQKRAPELGGGQREIDWIYMDDLVEGLIASAQAPGVEGDTIDLGSGVLVSIRTIVQKLTDMIDPEVKPLFGALPERSMEQVRVANIEDTYNKIGWKPTISMEKGLEFTVNWYKEELRKTSETASKNNV